SKVNPKASKKCASVPMADRYSPDQSRTRPCLRSKCPASFSQNRRDKQQPDNSRQGHKETRRKKLDDETESPCLPRSLSPCLILNVPRCTNIPLGNSARAVWRLQSRGLQLAR